MEADDSISIPSLNTQKLSTNFSSGIAVESSTDTSKHSISEPLQWTVKHPGKQPTNDHPIDPRIPTKQYLDNCQNRVALNCTQRRRPPLSLDQWWVGPKPPRTVILRKLGESSTIATLLARLGKNYSEMLEDIQIQSSVALLTFFHPSDASSFMEEFAPVLDAIFDPEGLYFAKTIAQNKPENFYTRSQEADDVKRRDGKNQESQGRKLDRYVPDGKDEYHHTSPSRRHHEDNYTAHRRYKNHELRLSENKSPRRETDSDRKILDRRSSSDSFKCAKYALSPSESSKNANIFDRFESDYKRPTDYRLSHRSGSRKSPQNDDAHPPQLSMTSRGESVAHASISSVDSLNLLKLTKLNSRESIGFPTKVCEPPSSESVRIRKRPIPIKEDDHSLHERSDQMDEFESVSKKNIMPTSGQKILSKEPRLNLDDELNTRNNVSNNTIEIPIGSKSSAKLEMRAIGSQILDVPYIESKNESKNEEKKNQKLTSQVSSKDNSAGSLNRDKTQSIKLTTTASSDKPSEEFFSLTTKDTSNTNIRKNRKLNLQCDVEKLARDNSDAQRMDDNLNKDNPQDLIRIIKGHSTRTAGIIKFDDEQRKLTTYIEPIAAQVLKTGCLQEESVSSSPTKKRRPAKSSASKAKDRYRNPTVVGESVVKSREKILCLGRSSIHSWGLFAGEDIEGGSMVVEYLGEIVRQSLANAREKKYEIECLSSGQKIASSYLFRLDLEWVLDATKRGNIARFINHSCDPVCIARTIVADGENRIAMYAKKDIKKGDEITYDYKFPLESDLSKRILCLCSAKTCRKYLN